MDVNEHEKLLLLPNTDHLQQVEDCVRGCTWQLKEVNIFYRFHELVFDRGENILDISNQATRNYRVWQWVPVRYCTMEKRLSLLSLTMKDNERQGMHPILHLGTN